MKTKAYENFISGILDYAKDKHEEQQIVAFVNDEANRDFLEQVCLISASYSGWAILSSGKEVYVSPTQASASEVGSAFKRLLENM